MTPTLKKYLNSPLSNRFSANAKLANRKVINLFQQAAKEIPAYKQFLKSNQLNPTTIKTIKDYKQVPHTTKENYINAYPLESRCWYGDLKQASTFAASSGTTGNPVFWPRSVDQEIEGAIIHEQLLSQVFEVNHHKTLVVNCFGLGNWIAGMYTHSCLYLNQLKGMPFTLANPGFNEEEILKVIKQLSHHYKQTLLFGHPPILKMIFENAITKGFDFKNLNVKCVGAAEGFSENWREYLMTLIHQSDPLRTITNIYGSADAGLMATETPYSIAIHRETSVNPTLNHKLFHSDRNPYLYQFNPLYRYLESDQDEIIISMNGPMPLLRYNIHDHGNTLSFRQTNHIIQANKPNFFEELDQLRLNYKEFTLPFVYIFGRKQFTLSLYAVNIYPENIKAALDHLLLQPHLTGRFLAEKNILANHDQQLEIRLELKPGSKATKKLERQTLSIFLDTFKRLNSEYNQVEQKFGAKMHPKIIYHCFNHPRYFPEGKTIKTG